MPLQNRDQAPPPARDAGRLVPGEPLPLRVGFVGERARRMLGSAVDAVAVRRWRGARRLAALVVDGDAGGRARRDLERLVARARETGAVVIGIADGRGDPPWGGLADLVFGDTRSGVPAAPPVDPRAFNPIGFRGLDAAGYAAVVSRRDGGAAVGAGIAAVRSLAGGEPVAVLSPDDAELPILVEGVRRLKLEPTPAGLLDRVRGRLGVIDHPSFHTSAWERAGAVVRLCAAGVPVVLVEPAPALRDLLGGELFELVASASPIQLADLDSRERLSVAVRRLALRDHSVAARWRQICAAAGIALPSRPLVSVIFSTRREQWLAHGLAQIERQTYAPRELVACLHGDEFSPDVEERIRDAVSGPVNVVRVDGELTLGDALNAGVRASEGELVTKMDDDDYYNVDHLWDLVLACEYSRAELVGKGAEFVYLGGGFDLTIRRFMGDGESEHPRLAGGALMARRGPLTKVGGWPARNRGEDTWIVKNFRAAGHSVYRTHGFGYILNRHFRGHTWNTYVDYFLAQSQREWRGLRFDESAIEP